MLNIYQHLYLSLDRDGLRFHISNELLRLDTHVQAGKILKYFVIKIQIVKMVFLSRTSHLGTLLAYNSLFISVRKKDHAW